MHLLLGGLMMLSLIMIMNIWNNNSLLTSTNAIFVANKIFKTSEVKKLDSYLQGRMQMLLI